MNLRFRNRFSSLKHLFPRRVLQLWLWLFLAMTLSVKGQVPDLRFQYFTHDQGLYSTYIHDVVQDSAGYIWVASRDGLFRYDAYGFKGYYPDESDSTSLSSSLINCLFVDNKGIIWVGTEEGLHKYEPSGDNFVRVPVVSAELGTAMPPISQIGADHQGNILVSTENQVLVSKMPGNGFEHLILLEGGQVARFLPDSMDMIWIGCTENHGLTRYNSNGQAVELSASPSDLEFLSGLNVTDLALLGDQLWISALGAGVIVYNPDTGELKRIPGRSWDEDMVVAVYPDRAGNIWTVDYAGLKVRQDTMQIAYEYYPLEGDPETVRGGVSGIFEDNQGNYWIYHRTNGLGISVKRKGFNKLDAYARQFLSTKDLKVSAIQEDESGELWIGQAEGGIRRYNWQDWNVNDFDHNPQDPYSLGRGAVLTLYRDSRGTMWIGTYFDGLQYYEASTGRFITFRHNPDDPNSISGNDIRSIVEDEQGSLWLAVHGKGIDRFDPHTHTFTHFNNENNGLSNNWTFQLLLDREGGLWAGTAWGLNYLAKGSEHFVNYLHVDEEPSSLSDNFITTLHLDETGTFWAGTQNGLNRYHPESETFTRYLNSARYSFISGILSDDELNLWISYRSGLLKMNPDNNTLTDYGSLDGLQCDGYNVRSFYKNPKGEFFFGGNNGIDLFIPSELLTNTTPPGIVIGQVRILDKHAHVDSTGIPVSILVNPTGALTLTPSQFMITLSFKALNFINPENNRYMTLLEGLDRDWNDLGTNREVSYTNLDAGTYTFRVRGSNNDGVWSSTDAILKIRVLPSWYETWVFRIILALVILGGIYLILVIRTSNLRTRATLLDKMVQEKTGELQNKTEELEVRNRELDISNNTKDKLMSIIAHDLINPFNSLIGMSELLMKRIDKLGADERKQYSELIHSSAQSAYALLQNLLAWARSQTGQIKHLPEILDLRTIIQDILELNMANLEAKSIHVETACKEDVKVWGDKEMISTVIRNLVNNAIKFVPKDGKISMCASKENGRVKVEIKDTGIGMPPEKVEEIQDSISVSPSPGTDGEKGSGLGLSLCKEFIRLHGGQLEIESEVGKGSTFSFTLPAKNTD